MAITAVTSPTRNSITTGMMKQKDGMVCSVSMIGRMMPATRWFLAASTPIGMPMIAAISAATPHR